MSVGYYEDPLPDPPRPANTPELHHHTNLAASGWFRTRVAGGAAVMRRGGRPAETVVQLPAPPPPADPPAPVARRSGSGHSKTYPDGLIRWVGLTRGAKPGTARKDYSSGLSPMTVEKLAAALHDSGWHDVTMTRAGDGTTATLATIGPRDEHGHREVRFL